MSCAGRVAIFGDEEYVRRLFERLTAVAPPQQRGEEAKTGFAMKMRFEGKAIQVLLVDLDASPVRKASDFLGAGSNDARHSVPALVLFAVSQEPHALSGKSLRAWRACVAVCGKLPQAHVAVATLDGPPSALKRHMLDNELKRKDTSEALYCNGSKRELQPEFIDMTADSPLGVVLEDWLRRESSTENQDDNSLFRCHEVAGDKRVSVLVVEPHGAQLGDSPLRLANVVSSCPVGKPVVNEDRQHRPIFTKVEPPVQGYAMQLLLAPSDACETRHVRRALLENEVQCVCVPFAFRGGDRAMLSAGERAAFNAVICAAAKPPAPRPWLVAVAMGAPSVVQSFPQLRELRNELGEGLVAVALPLREPRVGDDAKSLLDALRQHAGGPRLAAHEPLWFRLVNCLAAVSDAVTDRCRAVMTRAMSASPLAQRQAVCAVLLSLLATAFLLAPSPEAQAFVLVSRSKGGELALRGMLARYPQLMTALDGRGRSLLFAAAALDKDAVARLLLERGAAVDAPDADGATPLLIAAGSGSSRVLQLLLQFGAAPSQAALEAAIEGNDVRCVEILLAALAPDPAASWSAAHAAARLGDVSALRFLRLHGVSLTAADGRGRLPVQVAMASNHSHPALWLLQHHESPSEAMLDAAAEAQCVDCADALLRKLTSPSGSTWDTAHLAAAAGHVATLRLLQSRGVPIDNDDDRGWRPLHVAISRRQAGAVAALVDAGADVERPVCTKRERGSRCSGGALSPLDLALRSGCAGCAEALLLANAPPSWSAAHQAAQRDLVGALKLLHGEGIAVDAPAADGRRPLHVAAAFNSSMAFATLVAAGAALSCEARDHLRMSGRCGTPSRPEPLDEAATDAQCVGCVETALRALVIAPESAWSLAHRAARLGHTGALNALRLRGAALDGADKWRRRPLHVAAELDNAAAVGMLLQWGADPDAQDSDGLTPLDAAARAGAGDAFALLLSRTRDSSTAALRRVWAAAVHANCARCIATMRGAKAFAEVAREAQDESSRSDRCVVDSADQTGAAAVSTESVAQFSWWFIAGWWCGAALVLLVATHAVLAMLKRLMAMVRSKCKLGS